jgi:predicted amidohydrolase YtcJ
MLGKEGFEEYHRHRFPAQVGENQVSMGGVKIIVHETTGHLSPSQFELNDMILDFHRSEFQAVLHAIEGKTIDAACDAVENALQKSPRPDHRHRIEHCSVCTSSLAKRIASLGVIIIIQPSFIFYNGDRYLKTVPTPNLQHLYPIRTLMKNHVLVAGSSDSPIVPASPLVGIYSAISRSTEKGTLFYLKKEYPPWKP